MNQREVIHIALGKEACEVSAHWTNLQGLAATSGECVTPVTHRIDGENWYVPRTVFIDVPAAFVRQQQRLLRNPEEKNDDGISLVWKGKVDRIETSPDSHLEHDDMQGFFRDAALLAYAPFSRYRVTDSITEKPKSSYLSEGRHVVWDEEEEEPEDKIESEQDINQELVREQWFHATYQPIQQSLEAFWGALQEKEGIGAECAQSTQTLPVLSWTDYLMPPYSPKSCFPCPHDATSSIDWGTFRNGQNGLATNWRENHVSEHLRQELESCDSCQGFVLVSTPRSWPAGLSGSMLHELNDECHSARRLLVTVDNNDSSSPIDSWHTFNTARVQGNTERALALHQNMDLGTAILPLELPPAKSTFISAAWLGAGLEAMSLPYRLNRTSPSSLVGLNSASFYGAITSDSSCGTASALTFREFLLQLQPTPRHVMLEMDILSPLSQVSVTSLLSKFSAGTSLERDIRMRNPSHSIRNELPGLWLQSDFMLPVSPRNQSVQQKIERSLHQHFALSSSLRSAAGNNQFALPQLIDCLMESMGPRFKPERVTATILEQSLSQLTKGSYAAGSYWSTVCPCEHQPMLSVIGNTTRTYFYIDGVVERMKEALSPKLRGFFNRQVAQGALPELDDCSESLEKCLDLRDLYLPPEGSGLVAARDSDVFY